MHDTQLFVIGDSQTNFWNGTGHQDGHDEIPGIRSHSIAGALAYSLVKDTSITDARLLAMASVCTAASEDFRGWIMFNFGANDCNGWIWRHVPRLGIEEAVRVVVDRYISFIYEMREIYPKIAIFGPPASTKSPYFLGDVGTEPERNLLILLFTSMLKARLAADNIPVISIARTMIAPDGTSREDLYWDSNHASQAMMPYALQLVNQALGLQLTLPNIVPINEYRIRNFEAVEIHEAFDKTWLRFVIPQGSQYISEIGLYADTFAELEQVEIATSLDRRTYIASSYNFSDHQATARQRIYLPIGRYARNVLVHSPVRPIEANDVELFKYGSPISEFPNYCRESLFALHDQILQRSNLPVIAEEFCATPAAPRASLYERRV